MDRFNADARDGVIGSLPVVMTVFGILPPEATEAREAGVEAWRRGELGHYPPEPSVELVLPRIGPLVEDAVHRYCELGLPLFREVAEKRGVKFVFSEFDPSCIFILGVLVQRI